jgi:hypothetical protein
MTINCHEDGSCISFSDQPMRERKLR